MPLIKSALEFSITDDGKWRVIDLNPKSILERLASIWPLLIFLSLWSVACLVMTLAIIQHFSWSNFLFYLPFLISWLAAWLVIAFIILEKNKIYVGKSELVVSQMCVIPIRQTRVVAKDIVGIVIKQISLDDAIEVNRLEIETVEQPVLIAKHWGQDNLRALAIQLCSEIPALGHNSITYVTDQNEYEDDNRPVVAGHRVRQPRGSKWQFIGDSTKHSDFFRTGWLSVSGLALLLLLSLCWNGLIVAFYFAINNGTMELATNISGVIYFIMTPYVIVGGILIVALISSLLEPVRSTRFSFTDSTIIRRIRYFGIPFLRKRTIDGDVEMQIVIDRRRLSNLERAYSSDGNVFAITFNVNKRELMRIQDLTRADAEWITTQLEKERTTYRVVDPA